MKEKFKNAAEYWEALTNGHDIIKIDDTNEFWNDYYNNTNEELKEVNNERGLFEELDEYVTYIALQLNDEKLINNNCFKVYYSYERHYYIIEQLFFGIAADNVSFQELEELDELDEE